MGRLLALRMLQQGPTAFLTPPPPEQGQEALGLDFSPDGEGLALGGRSRVQVWHRKGGSPLVLGDYPRTLGIVGVVFGPRSDVLAAIRSGDVRLWSVPEARELGRGTFESSESASHGSFVTAVALDPSDTLTRRLFSRCGNERRNEVASLSQFLDNWTR